jgi:hypothetical protein
VTKSLGLNFSHGRCMKDMTETQTEVLEIWKDLSADEPEVVLVMLRGLKK